MFIVIKFFGGLCFGDFEDLFVGAVFLWFKCGLSVVWVSFGIE